MMGRKMLRQILVAVLGFFAGQGAVVHGRERALPSIANPALSADPAVRGAASVGLVTVGVIHALEIPGQIALAFWLTAGFFFLAIAAPLLGLWLLVQPSWRSWL